MDSTADNDYFELEPYDQYKPQEVSQCTLFLHCTKFCTFFESHFEESRTASSLKFLVSRNIIQCLANDYILLNNWDLQ
jgi:hypothetical protein